jgi:hypothetical protein
MWLPAYSIHAARQKILSFGGFLFLISRWICIKEKGKEAYCPANTLIKP